MNYEQDTLGTRMKGYEDLSDYSLSPGSYYIIRLDGNNFSKFTRKLKASKPYDERLIKLMTAVTEKVMIKFSFITGFTQSDEITLVPQIGNIRNDFYNLRIQKICSLVASYASVVFNDLLPVYFPFEDPGLAIFDARIFQVPGPEEVLNNLIWRQRDCIKNAKNLFGQQYKTFKELQNLTSDQQVELVESTTEFRFEDTNPYFRNGVILKRKKIMIEGYNPSLKRFEIAERGIIQPYSRVLSFSDENISFVNDKYS